MEDAVIEHFNKYKNSQGDVILGCKHISRKTGFKKRRVFALLNKSPKFTRVDESNVGFYGTNYSFYTLSNCSVKFHYQ